MYPFGSGMPYSAQPPTTAHGAAAAAAAAGGGGGNNIPFGAGWVAPAQQQQQQQQQPNHYHHHSNRQAPPYPPSPSPSSASHLHYEQLPITTIPPQGNNPMMMQYNNGASGAGFGFGIGSNVNSPYPPQFSNNSMPGNSSTCPYPPPPSGNPYSHVTHANANANHHQHGQHNPHYAQPAAASQHPTSYPPSHGYVGGYQSPASNMAHCFEEMSHHQHHHHNQQHGHNFPSHSSTITYKEGTPTVQPKHNFDPVKDAHDLRKAMKGFGTDEDALINIICHRSNDQRQEIQRQYKTHFGKDLIEDIKSETSANFEKLLVGLLRPIVDFYCCELNDAMAGIGTDEDVLIEILCTLSNMEIHTIKNQYLRLYGAHLESELKSETSGNFKRLLSSLSAGGRDESGHVDPIAAKNDARELLKAGELRVGTDESMFNMILCQRNYQQLKLIFQEYESITGHSLEKAIRKEFSGDIMEGLIAIYKCVTNKAEYFASRLHKSMAGLGTNDNQLIRVIITRCEIDMVDIKTAFERLYGKSLKSWIKGDTSGHYKHALYALVGEQRSS